MAQLIPLRGIRYTESAGPLDDLLAPPYDVISPAQREALTSRNPRNAVRLELAEGGDERYAQVADLFRSWEEAGVIRREEEDTLYVYEQEFEELGKTYRRRALICGVEAQPWEEGAVKPHEFTMSGPKEDRLNLLKATRVQFSPVFMLARDRAGQLTQFFDHVMAERSPDATARTIEDDGHKLWVVEAGRLEMRMLAPLLAESFYIADGHHRYETAVNYRDFINSPDRSHPSRFTMAAVVPANDPGLVIRPIHRLLRQVVPAGWETLLGGSFSIERVPLAGDSVAVAAQCDAITAERPGAILGLGIEDGQSLLFELANRTAIDQRAPSGHSEAWVSCSPNLLRYGILEPLWGIGDAELSAGVVEYEHESSAVTEWVMAEAGRTAFMIRHVGQDEVMALADGAERLPQKSTFFYPKLGTGLVFNPLYE